MKEQTEDEAFRRVAEKVHSGSKLLRAWPLEGGVSAQVTALEIRLPGGGTEKVVIRRHGAADEPA